MNDMSGQLVIQTGYMWTRAGCRRPGRTVGEAVPSVNLCIGVCNFNYVRFATTARIGESNEMAQMGRHLAMAASAICAPGGMRTTP